MQYFLIRPNVWIICVAQRCWQGRCSGCDLLDKSLLIRERERQNLFLCDFYCWYAEKTGMFLNCAIPILLSFNLKTMVRIVNNVTSSMRTMKYSEIKCSKTSGKIAMVSNIDLLKVNFIKRFSEFWRQLWAV